MLFTMFDFSPIFANLFFYSEFFCFSVINYSDQKRNKSWLLLGHVFYIFMIFYWVFIKQGAILKKWHFQHWPTAWWIRQKYVWNNNFRSLDPKMNLVTNNTIFFRHFKQGFSIFLEFFFIVVLYKSVTYNRLTDRCFFSLFTLRF